MKTIALLAAALGLASCNTGMTEPDDVETPTYHPGIQEKLLEDVRIDAPQGESIQYIAWSVDDRRALGPWTTDRKEAKSIREGWKENHSGLSYPWTRSLSEAESIRGQWASKYDSLNFTVLWRQDPAPTGGVLRVNADNVTEWAPPDPHRPK